MATALIVLVLMVGLISFIFVVARLKVRRLEIEQRTLADTSVSAVELEELIRRAVEDATEPIRADVEALAEKINGASTALPLSGSGRNDLEREARTIGRSRSSSSS